MMSKRKRVIGYIFVAIVLLYKSAMVIYNDIIERIEYAKERKSTTTGN